MTEFPPAAGYLAGLQKLIEETASTGRFGPDRYPRASDYFTFRYRTLEEEEILRSFMVPSAPTITLLVSEIIPIQ